MNAALTLQLVTEIKRDYAIYNISKRSLDILLAVVILILVTPILLILAIAIKLDSPGPIFYTQKRYGYKGRLFDFYKFRSMYIKDCKDKIKPKTLQDKRITRIGRIIRKNFLDELPQIINILKGDMSFVGPRPEQKFLVKLHYHLYSRRFGVKPGLTGLWQISGKKNPIYRHLKYDLRYIRHRSFWLDLQIIFRTIPVLIKGEQ